MIIFLVRMLDLDFPKTIGLSFPKPIIDPGVIVFLVEMPDSDFPKAKSDPD